MVPLFRKPPATTCFFCQQAVEPPPPSPRSFRCPHCECLNRYDSRGRIVSDEPAMHDPSLNSVSFARRASPTKNRLPSSRSTSSLLCHNCQTNQTLVMNLLANYLPSESHPEYAVREANMSAYRESLYARYPQVCNECLPTVQDELRRKEVMARTSALGHSLDRSKENNRTALQPRTRLRIQERRMLWWRIRGALWMCETLLALVSYTTGALGHLTLPNNRRYILAIPLLLLLSPLWMYWDFTHSSVRRARLQRREVRVAGRTQYIRLQTIAWLLRLLISSFISLACYRPAWNVIHLLEDTSLSSQTRVLYALFLTSEAILLIRSCFVLRIHTPPAVRLIDSTTHTRDSIPATVEPGGSSIVRDPDPFHLSTLSLSAHPVTNQAAPRPHAINPIFGRPSLPLPTPPFESASSVTEDLERDPDAMDWTPTSPREAQISARAGSRSARDSHSWLFQPQRFFAPEQPTGLEDIFARTSFEEPQDMRLEPALSVLQDGAGRHNLNTQITWAEGALFIPILAGVAVTLAFLWGSFILPFMLR